MKRFVVDASVAVKWYLPEEHTETAERLLSAEYELLAPDLLFAEAGSVLWKRAMRDEITTEKARSIMEALRSVQLSLWQSGLLLDAAMTIACRTKRSFYDSLYVALALTAECRLVTADRKLYLALKDAQQIRRHLLWIEDLAQADQEEKPGKR